MAFCDTWHPLHQSTAAIICLFVLVALWTTPGALATSGKSRNSPPPPPKVTASSTPEPEGFTPIDFKHPCSQLGFKFRNKKVVLPSDFKACVTTFQYNRSGAVALLDTMWKVLVDIYPYVNLARNSPSPNLPLKVRLRLELMRINFTNYATDFDFQKDLYQVVNSLQDGHTAWSPTCYTAATAYTAFPLVQTWDKQTGKYKVSILSLLDLESIKGSFMGTVFKRTEELLNITIKEYESAEIFLINGVPVLDYIEQFAGIVGGFRDQQARINSLFARPAFAAGSYYPGYFARLPFLPDQDNVTYTLQVPGYNTLENLVVPYIMRYKGTPFLDGPDYFDLNCKAPEPLAGTPKASMGMQIRDVLTHHHKPKERPSMRHPVVPEFMKAENFGFQALSNKIDDVQVYMLDDGLTAVMTIPDFLGSAANNESLTTGEVALAFLAQLLTAYNTVSTSSASRLIIDVSNNGGGFTVAGSFLTQLLFPKAGNPQFLMQFKAPPFVQAAYAAASAAANTKEGTTSDYAYTSWIDPKTSRGYATAADFLLPLQSITQNNYTANFSSLFHSLNYFSLLRDYSEDNVPKEPLFKPENVIVVSNGLCYSTCGIFTYQLRQRHKVKIVNVGGRSNNQKFAFAAGTVGFVVEDFDEYYQTEIAGLKLKNLDSSPKPLPFKGTLSWTLSQAYGPKSSTIPQEFIYEPGQVKLRYTKENVLSLPKLWNEVAALFPAAS